MTFVQLINKKPYKFGGAFGDPHICDVFTYLWVASMAIRRLLSHAFQERQLFRISQNALHGHGSVQSAEIAEFQWFDPWFLQRRGVVIPAQCHARPSLLHGDRWAEELKNLNNSARDRLHQEFVSPQEPKISAEEGRRLLRLVQMDSLLKRLCQIPHGCISRKELLQISMDSVGEDNYKEVVKSFDEAG